MKRLDASPRRRKKRSLPIRERGLKHPFYIRLALIHRVAPHTGAWIETLVNIKQCLERLVAPHTGAWIETAMAADFFGDVYGRSPGNQYFSGHSIKRHFPEPVLYSTLTIQWGKDNLRVFVSGSNDLTNGLAFCLLHKQLFAGGAFTFIPHNKQYVCQLSRLATGDRGLKEWLWRYHDHYLSRPNEPLATPKSEYVTWHRKEVFRGLPISF